MSQLNTISGSFDSSAALKQHVFPLNCVARFANDKNQVRVNFLDGSVKWIAPEAPLFQTENNWPKEDESGWMRKIESAYFEISEQALEMEFELSRDDAEAVTKFFLLWRYRYRFSEYGVGSVTPEPPSTPATQGGKTGKSARQLIEEAAADNEIRWSSYHYRKGNLIVPDCPPDVAYLPVSPSVALAAAWTDKPAPGALNEMVKRTSKKFYYQHRKFIPRS